RVREAVARGHIRLAFRHRVNELIMTGGAVTGVRGSVLEPSDVARGGSSSREVAGAFELSAPAVVITSGGIGGDHQLVRESWPERLGPAPGAMLSGVPAHVDGRMIGIAQSAGANLVN